MIKSLEQMLEIVPSIGISQSNYATIDVFTGGYAQMDHMPGHSAGCICPLCDMGRMEFERQSFSQFDSPSSSINPADVPYGNQTGLSGEIRDTFKIESYDSPCDIGKPAFDSGFNRESVGNISQAYNLGEFTGEQRLSNYGLKERYDFSEHNNTVPHLNQDIINIETGINLINSGTSTKNDDGFKGLGMTHCLDLFKK